MSKLDGVKVTKMSGGMVEEILYRGTTYARVDEDGRPGDIGLRVKDDCEYAEVGSYYPIKYDDYGTVFEDDEGERPALNHEKFVFFRPSKSQQIKEGDKVRLVYGGGEYPLNLMQDGQVFTVTNTDRPHHTGNRIELCGHIYGYAEPNQLEKVEQPSYATVKRPAEPGERILITSNAEPIGPQEHQPGSVLTVEEANVIERGDVLVEEEPFFIDYREYEVIVG